MGSLALVLRDSGLAVQVRGDHDALLHHPRGTPPPFCDPHQAIAGLEFCGAAPWILAVLGYDGQLKIHQIALDTEAGATVASVASSTIDMRPHFNCVGAMSYSERRQLLIVAGLQGSATSDIALHLLRPIDEHPFFADVESKAVEAPLGHDAGADRTIFDVKISPDHEHAALLNCAGDLCIVQVPSLELVHVFPLETQIVSGFGQTMPLPAAKGADEAYFGAISVMWWSETSVVVSLASGETAILHLPDLTSRVDKPIAFKSVAATTATAVFTDRKIGMPAFYLVHSEAEGGEAGAPAQGTGICDAVSRLLFSCTGMDRFYPSSQLPPSPAVYCISRFQSISPQALYRRKVLEKNYDEATALATKYALDLDIMLKKQWEEEPMTPYSVQAFLSQMKDRAYVFAAIQASAPPKADAALSLYELGLTITASETAETAAKNGTWDTEQAPLYQLRHLCITAVDRLKSYEVITTCRQSDFDPDEFYRFSHGSVLSMAIALAQEASFDALRILFARHSDKLDGHLLAVLFMVPETHVPADLLSFLPKCKPSGSSYVTVGAGKDGASDRWRAGTDWVEAPAIVDALIGADVEVLAWNQATEDLAARGYDDVATMQPSCVDDLTRWFRARAMAVEQCGLIHLAHKTLAEGIGRGIPGLDGLLSDLQGLMTLVYECDTRPAVGLRQYQSMSYIDKARAMVAQSTDDSFVVDVRTRVMPLFIAAKNGTPQARQEVLCGLFAARCTDNLVVCHELVKASSLAMKVTLRLVQDPADLVEIFLACVYVCTSPAQMGMIQQVYELMPDNDVLGGSEHGKRLGARLDELETHITAASIYNKYGQSQTPRQARELLARNAEEGGTQEHGRKMLAEFVKAVVQQNDKLAWTSFTADVLDLRAHLYSNLSDGDVQAIMFDNYLSSVGENDDLKLAGQFFGDEEGKLPRGIAANIVVGRAQEFFNAANSGEDPYIELAQKLLLLITPPTPAVKAESDLIRAFHGMLEEYSVHMMPVQFRLRLSQNRMSVVDEVLAKNTEAYQDPDKVIRFARLLGIVPATEADGVDTPLQTAKMCAVRVRVASAACTAKDWPAAHGIIDKLAQDGYADIWQMARQLGSEAAFDDYAARRQLLSHALLLCPDYELVATLKAWRGVEICSLCPDHLKSPADAGEEREACSAAVLQAGLTPEPEPEPDRGHGAAGMIKDLAEGAKNLGITDLAEGAKNLGITDLAAGAKNFGIANLTEGAKSFGIANLAEGAKSFGIANLAAGAKTFGADVFSKAEEVTLAATHAATIAKENWAEQMANSPTEAPSTAPTEPGGEEIAGPTTEPGGEGTAGAHAEPDGKETAGTPTENGDEATAGAPTKNGDEETAGAPVDPGDEGTADAPTKDSRVDRLLECTDSNSLVSQTCPFYEGTAVPVAFCNADKRRQEENVYYLHPAFLPAGVRQCQTFLRVYMMSVQDASDATKALHSDVVPEALLSLALESARHTTPLSVAYLLALSNAESLRSGFIPSVPNVERCLQMLQYCLALCVCMGAPKIRSSVRKRPAALYLHPMQAAIHFATRHVADGGDAPTEETTFALMLSETRVKISELSEMHTITAISSNVDVQRFSSDKAYRRETVLALAADPKHFNFMCQVGQRYSVPMHELYSALAKGLVATTTFASSASQEALLDTFRVLEGLSAEPVQSHQSVVAILDAADGDNLEQQFLCYKILAHLEGIIAGRAPSGNVAADGIAFVPLKAAVHLDNVRRLRAVDTRGLNYRDLLQCTAPLEVMKPHVQRDNVRAMADVLPALRPAEISASLVYSVLCVRELGQLPSFPTLRVETQVDNLPHSWVKAYHCCKSYFDKLCQHGLWTVYNEALGTDYMLLLPVAARLLIVRDLQAMAGQSEPSTVAVPVPGAAPLATQLRGRLAVAVAQLSALASESTLGEVEKVNGEYVSTYSLARGDIDVHNALVRRMLLDGVALELTDRFVRLINKVLGDTGTHVMSAVELFEELVVGVTQEFMGRHPRHFNESQTLQQCLALAKASTLDFAGKSAMTTITATIRRVCDDPAHEVAARIALFRLLAEAKGLDDPAEEKHVPLFYQTQARVSSVWPGRLVAAVDVANEGARRALFKQLHELCCSETEADAQKKAQVMALADTLSLWLDTDEASGASSYCDFWMHVFRQSAATESVGWVGLADGIAVASDGARGVLCSRNVCLHVGEELEIMASLDTAVAESSPVAGQWTDAVLAFGMASRFAEVKALATSRIAAPGAPPQGPALSPAFVKTAAATDMVQHLAAGAYFKPAMAQFVAQSRAVENCETLTEVRGLSARLPFIILFYFGWARVCVVVAVVVVVVVVGVPNVVRRCTPWVCPCTQSKTFVLHCLVRVPWWQAEELLWSGSRVAGQLQSAGLWPQHGLLAMLLRHVPETFQTLDVALFMSSA